MIIKSMDVFVIKVPEHDVGASYLYLIRLVNEDGVYGWGETAVLDCLNRVNTVYPVIMTQIFDSFVKGCNPFDRERISKTISQALSGRHSDLIIGGYLSAFDTALWDICGKLTNQPIYNLMGGMYRNKLRSYSYIYPKDNSAEPKAIAEEAVRMVEMGFTAIKYDPIPFTNDNDSDSSLMPFHLSLSTMKKADKIMEALRLAVGDDIDILVGTHGQMTTSSAIRLAKILEPYNPLWYEEPTGPENIKEIAKIKVSTSIPVSTGERMTGLFDFQRVLEEDAAAILQPDIGACGGITEAKKIATLAEAHHAEMAFHVWGGPVITAASICVDTTIPNFLIQESIADSSSGLFGAIQSEKIRWEKGYFYPSTAPGIGVDFDIDMLNKYAVNR